LLTLVNGRQIDKSFGGLPDIVEELRESFDIRHVAFPLIKEIAVSICNRIQHIFVEHIL